MRGSSSPNAEARQAIKDRMRRALGRDDNDGAREEVSERLLNSTPTLIPARADLEPADRLNLFIEKAKAVQTDVERVDLYEDVPERIAQYLRAHNLPMQLVRASDPRLDQLDWSRHLIETREGSPGVDDAIGLTTAFAGIAETGTLLLSSDAGHPTMLAFLPETAIILLPSQRVARAYEDTLHAYRADRSDMPRSINFITGPSRSGDIEQTLQLGAHGPKRLLIMLVDQECGEPPIPDIATKGGTA